MEGAGPRRWLGPPHHRECSRVLRIPVLENLGHVGRSACWNLSAPLHSRARFPISREVSRSISASASVLPEVDT